MEITRIQSQSNPEKSYVLTAHSDGVVSCSCPSWKFQRVAPALRCCKHIRQFGVLKASRIAAAVVAPTSSGLRRAS